CLLALLLRAHPRPREAAVIAGVVRVVGRERVDHPAVLEHLVPMDRRVAAPDLELARGIPDLDPDESGAVPPLLGAEAAPVGVGEIRNTAVLGHPRDHLLERGELVL